MSSPSEIATYRLEDLEPQMKYDFDVLLTRELIDQFAHCSGDLSPIHMSQSEAALRGFRGRVAHGMLLGAELSRLVGCHLPGRHALLMSATFQFHKPCFEGDLVRIEGTIDSISSATRSVTMSFRFTVGDTLHAKAAALVGVHA